VTRTFFTELADLLDRLFTTTDAFILVSQLEHAMDPDTIEFCDFIAGYSPTQQTLCVMYNTRGTLGGTSYQSINTVDVGLSDHACYSRQRRCCELQRQL